MCFVPIIWLALWVLGHVVSEVEGRSNLSYHLTASSLVSPHNVGFAYGMYTNTATS